METEIKSNRCVVILRWIVFAPGAILASYLAGVLTTNIGRFCIYRQTMEPNSLWAQLYCNIAGPAAMGAAFVYAGARIAPANRLVVSYVLASVGLAIAGFFLFPAVMGANLWAIVGDICIALGVVSAVYLIRTGETDIE